MQRPGHPAFLLISRKEYGISYPDLAEDRERWVLRSDGSRPVRQKLLFDVRIGVLPDSVQPRAFDPPETVLDKVPAHE